MLSLGAKGRINPTPGVGSSPAYLTAVGDTLFFVANDGSVGEELWKATSSGVTLVKDIAPGSDPLIPSSLAAYAGKLYFSGNDGASSGEELWVSDGTQAGTVLLKDINPSGNANPTRLMVCNGLLFFQASDGVHGFELWKSDGSAGGTVMVKDIHPGGGSSSPTILTDVNGVLFFVASDPEHGEELWKSDGTQSGTVLVKDIFPGPGGSSIRFLTPVNGTLFFRAHDGVHGEELWKSDGSPAGTVMVKDIYPGSNGSSPASLEIFQGMLFLRADDGSHGSELWKSDGTQTGTALVVDLVPGSGNSQPSGMTATNQALFFSAIGSSAGRELWKSDGSPAGTQLIKDLNPGSGSSTPSWITNISETIFLQAQDGSHGAEMWKSHGSAASTLMVADIAPGTAGSSPEGFTRAGNKLYFTADDGVHGRELWALDMQNQPPTVEAGGPYTGIEGAAIPVMGIVSDDDNVILALWTASRAGCTFANPGTLQTTLTCTDNGLVTLTLEVQDWWNVPASDQASASIGNASPRIVSISYSAEPALLGAPVAVTVQFSDPGSADTHTATIDWGEGPLQSMTVNQGARTATASHVYLARGRYTIRVVVTDDDGASAEAVGEVIVQQGLFLPLISR